MAFRKVRFDPSGAEPRIVEPIIQMNLYSWLQTTQSCEGHIAKYREDAVGRDDHHHFAHGYESHGHSGHHEPNLIAAPAGMVFYSPGYLDFQIEPSSKFARPLSERMAVEIKNGLYFGKNIYQQNPDEFSLMSTIEGLVKGRKFPTQDEHYHPSGYVVPYSDAIGRSHQFEAGVVNMLNILKGYPK